MQIKRSRDLDKRTRSAKAAMSVDEFLARFPEIPRDLISPGPGMVAVAVVAFVGAAIPIVAQRKIWPTIA